MQLSIFDITPHSDLTSLRYPNPKKAHKLRELAESLQPHIEAKLNPAIAQRRVTHRRSYVIASMRQDGKQLQQIQSWLLAMAEAAEEGILPDILNDITSKTQLEILWSFIHQNWPDSSINNLLSDQSSDWYKKLKRAKLDSLHRLKKAISALQSLHSPTPEDPITVRIQQLEHDLIGRDIPGYFPTPRALCERMVKLALLRHEMRVLEPSAGKGSIAEIIREVAQVQLDVCEQQYQLREILKLKGFKIIASDFFDVSEQYDRILMNPPFGKGQEIQHIRHAYHCLASEGRLVAIASNSFTFRKELIYREFRDWLTDKCVLDEALPDGTFLKSDRPTGVSARLLVLEK